MAEDVGHRCELVVWTDAVEFLDVFEDLVGQGEVFLCDIVERPQLHLVIGV